MPADVADRIWSYVQRQGKTILSTEVTSIYSSRSSEGSSELISQLRNDTELSSHKPAMEALNDLDLLSRYLTIFNVMDKV